MDHEQPRSSLHPAGVEPLDHRPPVAVATEKHGRVFRLEHHQARKGGSTGIIRRWPGEAALILQRDALQLAPQLLQASLSVVAQVEPLQIRRDWFLSRRLVALHHLENRFAERPRLGEFGKAPAGSAPVRRLQDHQGLAALDLLIKRALPIGSSSDPAMFIKIKKGWREVLAIQPVLQLGSIVVVTAGMREEDSGHASMHQCSNFIQIYHKMLVINNACRILDHPIASKIVFLRWKPRAL